MESYWPLDRVNDAVGPSLEPLLGRDAPEKALIERTEWNHPRRVFWGVLGVFVVLLVLWPSVQFVF